MRQLLIPSGLSPPALWALHLTLSYTCKKRVNKLLAYTLDLGMNFCVGVMGLGSSYSLKDIGLGKQCCSTIWSPLSEGSFSPIYSFLPESINLVFSKRRITKHTLWHGSRFKMACLISIIREIKLKKGGRGGKVPVITKSLITQMDFYLQCKWNDDLRRLQSNVQNRTLLSGRAQAKTRAKIVGHHLR